MLTPLPSQRQSVSISETIGGFPCARLKMERAPSKENPNAKISKLTPAGRCFRFLEDEGFNRNRSKLEKAVFMQFRSKTMIWYEAVDETYVLYVIYPGCLLFVQLATARTSARSARFRQLTSNSAQPEILLQMETIGTY